MLLKSTAEPISGQNVVTFHCLTGENHSKEPELSYNCARKVQNSPTLTNSTAEKVVLNEWKRQWAEIWCCCLKHVLLIAESSHRASNWKMKQAVKNSALELKAKYVEMSPLCGPNLCRCLSPKLLEPALTFSDDKGPLHHNSLKNQSNFWIEF